MNRPFCRESFISTSKLYYSPLYWNIEKNYDIWDYNFEDDTIFERDQCFHDSNFI